MTSQLGSAATAALDLPRHDVAQVARTGSLRSVVRPIPALTSVRGLAAWWVVLFHFYNDLPRSLPQPLLAFTEQGYLAVDLFFQLSGFVIALNYAADFQELRLRRILRFLVVRLARIYPLHLTVLMLFLFNPIAIGFFSAQGEGGSRYDPAYFFMSLILVQNWGFTSIIAWNIPAWSISTEWFAYLLFPFAVRLMHGTAPGVYGCLAVLGALLGALAALSPEVGLGGDIAGFGLTRCVISFCIGITLFRLHISTLPRRRLLSEMATLLAMGCFAAYVALPVPDHAVMPLGFLLLIYAMADETSTASRLLQAPGLEWVGLISYSTYLIHYFIKDWVKFLLLKPGIPAEIPVLVYLALTALASVLLYRFVEVPGRRAIRAFA